MKIFNIDMSHSGGGVRLSGLSRWWLLNGRTVVFLFILVIFLPYACSDEPHLPSTPHDRTKYRYAQINITFMDPEKKKEVHSMFEGKYGMKSDVRSASGTVMHTLSLGPHKKKNHYGCTPYVNSKFPSEQWIALVERGDCVFTNKIKVATKDHNASAIVIYNNASGDVDTVMDHQPLQSISVFIGRDEGIMIAKQLDKGIPVTMHIWPGREGSLDNPHQNSISKTSVLFVSISFIVLMIISLAWLVFYYIQRFRYSHAKERLARRLACAAKKAIAKIPQKTVKVGDKELDSEFDQCAVCIEPYKAHDVIRILPCRHVFHKSCVDPWLLDQRSCPMCKLDILRAYGMQIGGSQESVHHDPESGPVTTAVQDEPEVSSSVEDTQTEEVKVLLVPHACLHFHVDGEKTENEEEEAATSLLGAVGGSVQPSASVSSITSKGSSLSNSRAEKCDEAESGSSELKELIGKGKGGGGKRKWKNKKEVEEEEEEEEEEEGDNDDENDFGCSGDQGVANVIETVKTGQKKGKEEEKQQKTKDAHRKSSDTSSSSSSGELRKHKKKKHSAGKEELPVHKIKDKQDTNELSSTTVGAPQDTVLRVDFDGDEQVNEKESVA